MARRPVLGPLVGAACCLVLGLEARPVLAQPETPLLPALGVDELLDQPSGLLSALRQAGLTASVVPIFVRLVVGGTIDEPSRLQRLDDRIADYAAVAVQVVLVVDSLPATPDDADRWSESARGLAERYADSVLGYQIGLGQGSSQAPLGAPATYAFYLKLT